MMNIRVIWRRTPFDWFLVVFIVTAVIGALVSYDSTRAIIKLGNIVVAVVVYYVLAGQRRRDMWAVSGVLGALAGVIALCFLLTHNWQMWPTDLDLLTRVGLLVMRIQPPLPLPTMHPNVAGGLIAVLLPFQIAFGVYIYRRKKREFYGITAVLFAVTMLGFLLTSSRMAWLSVAAASGLCFLWLIVEKSRLGIRLPRWVIYLLFLGVAFIIGVGLIVLVSGHLPGANSSASRLELFQHTLDLIADFPFTGGGLAAFPGLYSQYIAVTPFFQFNYSHNLWLDVAFEQGIPGLLALIWIVVGSGLLLWRAVMQVHEYQTSLDEGHLHAFWRDLNLFRWATLIGLLSMVGHSLVDDALYGNLGTPLLFVLPGMAVAVSQKREVSWLLAATDWKFYTAWIAVVIIIMVVPRTLTGHSLAADWVTNQSALAMARIELKGWPTGQWDDGHKAAELIPANLLFQQAAAIDAENRTAQHRLGLIAMVQRDFETAVTHLETAYELDPHHRGIVKTLGYSYVWQGDLEKATFFLGNIPESQQEMEAYIHWWRVQQQPELATRAEQMANILQENGRYSP